MNVTNYGSVWMDDGWKTQKLLSLDIIKAKEECGLLWQRRHSLRSLSL